MSQKNLPFRSDREVPNPTKLSEANDFHEAARILYSARRSALLAYYVMGGLAVETYLKSLNFFWEYSKIPAEQNGEKLTHAPEGLPLSDYVQNTAPPQKTHNLLDLFNGLDSEIRQELGERYAAAPVVPGLHSFDAALSRYQDTFVNARSPSEHKKGMPEGPVFDLLLLLDFLGRYVNELHASNPNTKLRAQLSAASTVSVGKNRSGAEAVIFAGRIDSNAVVLDSGETLPDETIVDIWPRDGTKSVEIGVVGQGIIRLEWPGSIPDGTPVDLKVVGELLSPDQIDPFFRIGELSHVAADVDPQMALTSRPVANQPRAAT